MRKPPACGSEISVLDDLLKKCLKKMQVVQYILGARGGMWGKGRKESDNASYQTLNRNQRNQ